jgi:hypothetical protein
LGLKTCSRRNAPGKRRITVVSPVPVKILKDLASEGALIFPQAIQPRLVETLEAPFLEQPASIEISFESFPVEASAASVLPYHLPEDCFGIPEPGCAAGRVGDGCGAVGAQQGPAVPEKPFPFRKTTQALIDKAEPHPARGIKGNRLPIRQKFIDQPCVDIGGVPEDQPRDGFVARLGGQQTVLARPREDIIKHHEPLTHGLRRMQTAIAVVGLTDLLVKCPRTDMVKTLVAKSRQGPDMTKPNGAVDESLPESATFARDMRVELRS